MQIESDQLDYKSNKTASLPLEDTPFSENSGQPAAEQDFRILADGDFEDLYNFVRVLESRPDELEAAVKGSSTSERLTKNEVSLTRCENGTAHVSLDRKGLWMTNDIILDEISNIQDNKEEFNDKFQIHPVACIESIPGKCNISVKCSPCDETCDDLKCHLGTNTGERPHKCQCSEKRFTRHSNFSRHILIRTGKRPFKCSLCEKTFFYQSKMNQHIRTHTGERPYKCSICEKTFTQHSHMKRHIRTHTV